MKDYNMHITRILVPAMIAPCSRRDEMAGPTWSISSLVNFAGTLKWRKWDSNNNGDTIKKRGSRVSHKKT